MDDGGLRLTVRDRAAGMVEWRLLARNGRPLGVSRHAFPTTADAREAFVEMCRRHGALSGQFHHSLTATAWTWSVSDSGDAVAAGSRPYARRGTCASACTRFLDAVQMLAADPVLIAVDREAM